MCAILDPRLYIAGMFRSRLCVASFCLSVVGATFVSGWVSTTVHDPFLQLSFVLLSVGLLYSVEE